MIQMMLYIALYCCNTENLSYLPLALVDVCAIEVKNCLCCIYTLSNLCITTQRRVLICCVK